MARLLIVSRSMALAMRLADQHEVIEHPVDDLEELGTDLDADVLVLDIGDPIQAVTTVNQLRQAGQITPVLLVSGYQPEWEQVEAQHVDGVVVVPLPITRAALLTGIAQLTGDGQEVLEGSLDDTGDHEIIEDAGSAPAPDTDVVPAAEEADVELDGDASPAPGTTVQEPAPDEAAEPDQAVPLDQDEPDQDEPDQVPGQVPATTPLQTIDATGGAPDAAGSQVAEQAAGSALASASGRAGHGSGRAQPPWGSPDESGTDDLPDQSTIQPAAFGSSAPPSPPWGETIRVGRRLPGPGGVAGAPGGNSESSARSSGQPASPGDGGPDSGQLPGQGFGTDSGSQSVLGPPSRRLPRLGNRPRKLQRRPAPDTQGLGLVTNPLGPRTDPYGLLSSSPASSSPVAAPPATPAASATGAASALDRRLDSEAAAIAGDRSAARARSSSGIVMRPADLVQSLLDQIGDLYGVCDTAQVLADDVIERADADAAAILVPDGPVWRVSGGVGLRPLERRLILESTHWLITEIGSGGRAVLIDDTDIIRQQLSGAPLAAWRHLLAVPVPDVRAIVVLARAQEAGPFTDRDLSAVIAPVREAAALLAQAVQTRRLARALSALREADTETTTRRREE